MSKVGKMLTNKLDLMSTATICVLAVVAVAAIIAVYVGVVGLILMLAWNNIAPVFWAAAPMLSYWNSVLAAAVLAFVVGGIRGVVHSK